jgi:hypothetical protein
MKALTILIAMALSATSCRPSTLTQTEKEENMNQDIIHLVTKNDTAGVAQALKNGAEVNTMDNQKRSLLLIATVNQQTDMARLLVKQGANVNQQADNLDSPFLYAGASGQTKLVQLFLENGARFDVFNRYNGSALIPACERGHVETVQLLANTQGFPIDHVNRLGWTALMEAIVLGNGSKKYQQIVQILKDAGANLTIPDKDGITPLQHARSRGFQEIVDILKS